MLRQRDLNPPPTNKQRWWNSELASCPEAGERVRVPSGGRVLIASKHLPTNQELRAVESACITVPPHRFLSKRMERWPCSSPQTGPSTCRQLASASPILYFMLSTEWRTNNRRRTRLCGMTAADEQSHPGVRPQHCHSSPLRSFRRPAAFQTQSSDALSHKSSKRQPWPLRQSAATAIENALTAAPIL